MQNNDITYKLCPFCMCEVILPGEKLGRYKCPACGQEIINCSICETMNCADCPVPGGPGR